jgi:hypothetical protein
VQELGSSLTRLKVLEVLAVGLDCSERDAEGQRDARDHRVRALRQSRQRRGSLTSPDELREHVRTDSPRESCRFDGQRTVADDADEHVANVRVRPDGATGASVHPLSGGSTHGG